jgi:hypothetical protein
MKPSSSIRTSTTERLAIGMKLRIPINELRSGMFLEASVLSVMKDESVRHFLELRGASYSESTSRRMRLMKRRHEQVTAAGGMLVRSDAQVEALQGPGGH